MFNYLPKGKLEYIIRKLTSEADSHQEKQSIGITCNYKQKFYIYIFFSFYFLLNREIHWHDYKKNLQL